MKVLSNIDKLDNDLLDEVKLFFRVVDDVFVEHHFLYSKGLNNDYRVVIDGKNYSKSYFDEISIDNLSELHYKRIIKRYAKLNLYLFLSEITGKTLDWGSLTGVRPTILAYNNYQGFKDELIDVFKVSDKKVKLVSEIIDNQKGLYLKDDHYVDLYIGIPFCPSRCSYCSFSSGELSIYSRYMDEYVNTLCKDIEAAIDLIAFKNKEIRAIYIGGGTPTSLNASHFKKIFYKLKDVKFKEFTIEAGRPDTITKDKLEVFKEYGVDRISINPQTFKQETLDLVLRKHSIKDVIDSYKLAKGFGFIINMDLICGLPNESMEDFENSLSKAIELSPDNITVHSLALKEGSKLKNDQYIIDNDSLVKEMTEYAYKKLESIGYKPYYLYRQKYMLDNQENIGYYINNSQCLYNIDTIEESISVVACGAGGISKRVYTGEERINRQANIKDIILYIKRIDEGIANRNKLFK